MTTELNVIPVFSTPIGTVIFDEDVKPLNELLIYDIDKERSQKPSGMGTFNGNSSAWLSEYGLENKYASFDRLKELIISAVKPAMESVGFSESYLNNKIHIDSLWANVIFAKGGWAQPHIHGTGNTFWTGVYYPKGKDGLDDNIIKATSITVQSDGCLILSDPAKNIKKQVRSLDSEEPKAYPYYGANLYIEPRESLLVLFPAWLEHSVSPVMDDNIRYSISFAIDKL